MSEEKVICRRCSNMRDPKAARGLCAECFENLVGYDDCGHCGSPVMWESTVTEEVIRCTLCPAKMVYKGSKEALRHMWNARYNPQTDSIEDTSVKCERIPEEYRKAFPKDSKDAESIREVAGKSLKSGPEDFRHPLALVTVAEGHPVGCCCFVCEAQRIEISDPTCCAKCKKEIDYRAGDSMVIDSSGGPYCQRCGREGDTKSAAEIQPHTFMLALGDDTGLCGLCGLNQKNLIHNPRGNEGESHEHRP